MAEASMQRASPEVEPFDAVVVGAGWAGMYMLYRLRELGLRTIVLEAGGGIGGAWYWNRYPGARCDVPSLNYSFSFCEEIWREWEWSERYAAQPEIERYANFVADKLGLRADIALESRVTAAVYDEAARRWLVTTEGGRRLSARYAIMATGGYSAPLVPAIEDLDSFEGELYYTAAWPDREVDFTDKRVGVVGTGSSGMQSVTAIGEQGSFAHLFVFQRTPNYAIPGANAPMDPEYQSAFKERYPEFWETVRHSDSGTIKEGPVGPVLHLSDEEFEARMRTCWELGGPSVLNGISDLVVDAAANERVAEFLRERIRERVHNPRTAELLCAKSHYIGARRQLNENGYFEVYNQANVTLVDLASAPIKRLTARGIETEDGEYELDTIILATGFDSGTGALARIEITGRDSRTLKEKWAAGPLTYLGLAAEGFPNLFVLAGPGSPSIRSNVMVSIEQHVEWLSELVGFMEAEHYDTIEASGEAEASWTEHVAATVDATLIARNDTQYVGANVPGKPRVYLAYVGGVKVYRIICERVAEHGYEGFLFGRGGALAALGGPRWSGPPDDPGLRTRFGSGFGVGSPVI